MDLNFIQGLMGNGEKTASFDNTINYIAMKTLEGNITFIPLGDDRLNTVFSEWTILRNIDSVEHQTILNMINTCEWDKKVDFENGEFIKVEKYTAEERVEILTQRDLQSKTTFFNSEKRIALAIEEDYRLQLEPISELQMIEVKTYMKSIKPNGIKLTRSALIPRPEIMNQYDNM
ncbi:MAG: hypothetical protein ACRCX2_15025 [Paraclostridium sp.]